jgi:transcriptional regulator with XRE-family HTH domain
MQITSDTAVVPEWTLADRLRKARLHAGLEQAELAAQTGISRATIVNYENGHTTPGRPALILWALCTGVALPWLSVGEILPGTLTRPVLALAAAA